MSDGFSWKRLRQAARDVFLPWQGLRKVWGQLVAWSGVLGLTVLAAAKWTDVLPPSLRGKILFGALFLLLVGLGISAAYRLRAQLDAVAPSQRSERDALRLKALAAGQRIVGSYIVFAQVVFRNVPLEQAKRSVEAMRSALGGYSKACEQLPYGDATIHAHIQAAMESALNEAEMLSVLVRMQRPINAFLEYTAKFGIRGGIELDEDEAEALMGVLQKVGDLIGNPTGGSQPASIPEPDH